MFILGPIYNSGPTNLGLPQNTAVKTQVDSR